MTACLCLCGHSTGRNETALAEGRAASGPGAGPGVVAPSGRSLRGVGSGGGGVATFLTRRPPFSPS